jgi:three-Cys-motif partner protein
VNNIRTRTGRAECHHIDSCFTLSPSTAPRNGAFLAGFIRISVHAADANAFLQEWCRETDWDKNRAVVFLDPYRMQVDWSTIEAIAATEAIDLWILFPLGQAVNRLLTRNDIPAGGQAQQLTRFCGTEDWKEAFYEEASDQPNMFDLLGEESAYVKRANFDAIERFFVERLEQVFVGVSKNPLPL